MYKFRTDGYRQKKKKKRIKRTDINTNKPIIEGDNKLNCQFKI